jgi:hypothetical protein
VERAGGERRSGREGGRKDRRGEKRKEGRREGGREGGRGTFFIWNLMVALTVSIFSISLSPPAMVVGNFPA